MDDGMETTSLLEDDECGQIAISIEHAFAFWQGCVSSADTGHGDAAGAYWRLYASVSEHMRTTASATAHEEAHR
ncbi:MAG: hypothetical protein M3165_08535 [Actinomycetota bacterium]|nr:hypothetical protein [Actinomycetota bacterium]